MTKNFKDPTICDCVYHKQEGTACCEPCPVCRKGIKIGFMDNHLRNHCDIASLDQLRDAVRRIGLDYTIFSKIIIMQRWFHRTSEENRKTLNRIVNEAIEHIADNITVPEAIDFLRQFS